MENVDRIQEILERLVRMESKLDDFKELRDKADKAYTMAKQNAKDCEKNSKDCESIQADLKHVWYVAGTMAVAIIAFFIKITLYK